MDAQNVLGVEKSELSQVLSFSPGVGQNIALLDSPTSRISAYLAALSRFILSILSS